MSNSPWSPERVEELRKLWEGGLSAQLVARAMNCGISRNAVIGKIHRLGIAGRGQPTQHAPRTRSQTNGDNSLKMRMRRPKREVRPRPVEPAQAIPPGSSPVHVGDVQRGRHCVYPLWDEYAVLSEKFCCGSDPEPGRPYCTFHADISYYRGSQRDFDRIANAIIPGRSPDMGRTMVAA